MTTWISDMNDEERVAALYEVKARFEFDEEFLSYDDETFAVGEDVILLRTGGIISVNSFSFDYHIGEIFTIVECAEKYDGCSQEIKMRNDKGIFIDTMAFSYIYYIKNITHAKQTEVEIKSESDLLEFLSL